MPQISRKNYGIELFLTIIGFNLIKQFKSHITNIILNEKFLVVPPF